jgi:cell division protein FtsB
VKTKNLRQQVKFERRRRNAIFFAIISAAFFYIAAQLVFGNMGLLKYSALTKTKNRLDTEINALGRENKTLKKQIAAFKGDNFYIEKYAREEYGMAKPGEYIFQFKDDVR